MRNGESENWDLKCSVHVEGRLGACCKNFFSSKHGPLVSPFLACNGSGWRVRGTFSGRMQGPRLSCAASSQFLSKFCSRRT